MSVIWYQIVSNKFVILLFNIFKYCQFADILPVIDWLLIQSTDRRDHYCCNISVDWNSWPVYSCTFELENKYILLIRYNYVAFPKFVSEYTVANIECLVCLTPLEKLTRVSQLNKPNRFDPSTQSNPAASRELMRDACYSWTRAGTPTSTGHLSGPDGSFLFVRVVTYFTYSNCRTYELIFIQCYIYANMGSDIHCQKIWSINHRMLVCTT